MIRVPLAGIAPGTHTCPCGHASPRSEAEWECQRLAGLRHWRVGYGRCGARSPHLSLPMPDSPLENRWAA